MHILIVDDDKDFLEAFQRELGSELPQAKVTIAASVREADKALESEKFQVIMVDCLMPDVSGVDFLKTRRDKLPPEAVSILFSGVLTDPSFVDVSKKEAGAQFFFSKPIPLDELKKILEKSIELEACESEPSGSERGEQGYQKNVDQLYALFRDIPRNERRVRKILEQVDLVHGFDLPLIYQILMDAELSGYLNLQGVDSQRLSGVTFARGRIINVDTGDEATYLGNVLIEKGFIVPMDLQKALGFKGEKKIGEYLIENFLVSPHAVDIAMSEQLSIRLSKTVRDEFYRFNFVDSQVGSSDIFVSPELLNRYLHDWILSKLPEEWLLVRFAPWYFARVEWAKEYQQKLESVREFPLLERVGSYLNKFGSSPRVKDVLESYKEEPLIIKLLFFLLIKNIIVFSLPELGKDSAAMQLMQEVLKQLPTAGLKTLELLGIPEQSPETSKEILTHFLIPFLILTDPMLLKELKLGLQRLEKILKVGATTTGAAGKDRNQLIAEALQLLEEGKQLIQAGKFEDAHLKLDKAVKLNIPLPSLLIYALWAKTMVLKSGPADKLQSLENGLLAIPPEEKHDPLFLFVQGLVYKTLNRKEMAKRSFEKALSIDPNLVVARRELLSLRQDVGAQTAGQVKESSAKSLLGQLFKKREKR